MNAIEKILLSAEKFAIQDNRVSNLADKLMGRIFPQQTAFAGDCWPEYDTRFISQPPHWECRDRTCCPTSGCGSWSSWYNC